MLAYVTARVIFLDGFNAKNMTCFEAVPDAALKRQASEYTSAGDTRNSPVFSRPSSYDNIITHF